MQTGWNVENESKISFISLNKARIFILNDFHETSQCSIALHTNFLYWISIKSVNKYGKYGWKLIYACKWSVADQQIDTLPPNTTLYFILL
jgi:hypothetical protein